MIINHISNMRVIATLKCINMHPDVCMLEYNKFLCIILYSLSQCSWRIARQTSWEWMTSTDVVIRGSIYKILIVVSNMIPRRCYSNCDFLTSVEGSIVTPFMKADLLFMYTSYFYLTSFRSRMRLILWNDPCNVCDILVKSLCSYVSCRKRFWHSGTMWQGSGEELPWNINPWSEL